MEIFLVRHAMPLLSARQAPGEWPLSSAGRVAAGALGTRLPAGAVWVSSAERKAVQTLASASGVPVGQVVRDDRLGEIVRPEEPFDDDVRDRRLAWVQGGLDDRHHNWEPSEHAAARFQSVVADHQSAEALVLGTHGMVLAAWLVSIGQIRSGAPAGDFWLKLSFPDVVHVSLPTGAVG